MAKKNSISILGLLYLIGMAVTLIGFCCFPLFSLKTFLGNINSSNGFAFINFERSTFVSIGALLIFIGAVCGVALGVLSLLTKLSNANMLKLLALVVSILGGVIIVIGFATNGKVYAEIGKHLLKYASTGFYMVVAGWIVSLVGWLFNK